MKTATEKAKDCNLLWEREIVNERDPNSPHFRIITEIIITTEVIEKSFEWFEKNDKSVVEYKDDIYYLFWKQLNVDIRGWVKDKSKEAAQKHPGVYEKQINTIHSIFSKHFE